MMFSAFGVQSIAECDSSGIRLVTPVGLPNVAVSLRRDEALHLASG
jgi:hypothetical protein